MFFVRADGNEKIGMGHIMRCLSIAAALRDQGEEVTFLLADDKPQKLIEERGFQTHILFTYYDEMDVELPQLMMLFTQYPTAKILVDSYYVTEFYLKNLKLVTKVILMDDLKTEIYPCDALINYNIYGKTLGYEASYPEDVRLFTGCEFMPLRDVFLGKEAVIRPEVKDILLTTGGSDGCHMALRYVKHLAESAELTDRSDYVLHVVCGPYCEDTEELLELAEEYSWLVIHTNVTDMSEVMLQCDMAISAAGSTLYELCALGLPTIGFYFVDNQKLNMETFGRITPIMNAGNFALDSEKVMQVIDQAIALFSQQADLRDRMHVAMRTLVDGKGAQRLADALISL